MPRKKQSKKSARPAVQATAKPLRKVKRMRKRPIPPGGSPINGVIPPAEHRFPPGVSGNPAGRPAAGATIKEWLNQFAAEGLTERQLRAIARGADEPWPRRFAAERALRGLESGDLADFVEVLDGNSTLDQLRSAGVNTEVVKKCKSKRRVLEDGVTEIEREIELHDRSGDDFDRVMDRTLGRPTQAVDLTSNGETVLQFGDLVDALRDPVAADLANALGERLAGQSGAAGQQADPREVHPAGAPAPAGSKAG